MPAAGVAVAAAAMWAVEIPAAAADMGMSTDMSTNTDTAEPAAEAARDLRR